MLVFTEAPSRGYAVARGLLAAIAGGVLMAWPGITIGTVVVLFALYCFADAVTSGVRLFARRRPAGDRLLLGLRPVIEVAAGIGALAYPGATAGVMTVIIGLYAIAAGLAELAGSSRLSRLGVSGSGWLVAGGVLSILAGGALVVWPGIGAVTLAIVFGAYLLVYGVTLLVSTLASRDEEHPELTVGAP
jgi:uncharacterized membrane protein HdeD (DUF308 family)